VCHVYNREQHSVNKQLLQDGLDMLIPATGLGYLHLDDGAVGLIGYVSWTRRNCGLALGVSVLQSANELVAYSSSPTIVLPLLSWAPRLSGAKSTRHELFQDDDARHLEEWQHVKRPKIGWLLSQTSLQYACDGVRLEGAATEKKNKTTS
jgi:hypothetical protein